MKLRLLLGTVAALTLLGAGCIRTATPPPAPTAAVSPAPEAPTGVMPQAAAPAVSEEPKAPPLPLTPPPPPPASAPSSTLPTPEGVGTPTKIVGATISPTTHAVTIKDFSFTSSTLTVKAGDTVVWTQQDSVPHTVTSDTGSELGSPTLSVGQTYSHTFTTKGTFTYHCTPHPRMKATVVVE